MNRIQLEHIIRAASQISDDTEIVVIGSQAIHAQTMSLPPITFQSVEADVYPRNHPERADDIDAAIGELSLFHQTHGYYAHGISPKTAILPSGWEQRLIRLSNPNTGGAVALESRPDLWAKAIDLAELNRAPQRILQKKTSLFHADQ